MTMFGSENHIATAREMAAKNAIIQTIHAYAKAIEAAPQNTAYKNEFLRYLRPMNLRIESATLKSLMIVCLTDPNVDWADLGNAWYSFIKSDPSFKPLLPLIKAKKYPAFVKAMAKLTDATCFDDPYLLYGIGRTIVPNTEFERFLTHLRRYLLETHAPKNAPSTIPYVLARYCKRTGYIFFVTDEEKEHLSKLGIEESDQILLACYQDIKTDNVTNGSPAWLSLVQEETTLRNNLANERVNVNALTPIEDETSLKVKDQYEVHPYPVWESINPGAVNALEENALKDKKARVLVAGCGTGRESIELAATYPDADVLAIDLSTTSLAYAQLKARQLNIRNITFAHADILKLDTAIPPFDFIASSGVLHHMKDPYAGWSKLNALLKPGGTMRIGLYAVAPRWAINKSRNIIAKKHFQSDDDGIRAYRHQSRKLLGWWAWKNVTGFYDYYLLNECRDMLFHVQEEQFTIPRLKDFITKLGLTFEGFYLSPKSYALYQKAFPQDTEKTNLDYWEKFEKKNPNTFKEMYRFWCKKT